MNNIYYSFLLTTLAGLSTTLGFFIIFIKGDKGKIISFFLSFASGVMFIISLIDLLPSSFDYLNNYFVIYRLILIAFFVIIGILLSNYINHYVECHENNNLTKLGILSFISIVLHNLPEGIITFMATQIDIKLGISLVLAISMHNIPEGISIAIPLYYSGKKKILIFLIVLIAGLSELLGAFLTYLFLIDYINNFLMAFMFSITAGVMLNISLFSLLKEGCRYNRLIAIMGFILGNIVMIISSFYI